jgi:hypothetical protein
VRRTFFVLLSFSLGCAPGEAVPAIDGGRDLGDAASDGSAVRDGGVTGADAAHADPGVAPMDAIPGEDIATGDTVLVDAPVDEPVVVRVDVQPSEHITFFLTFDREDASVELEVLRWDGASPVSLGVTDAGPGLRTLAAFDPTGPRTFWARITAHDAELASTLTITRVPFEDAPVCESDCAHLLQLPLANDPLRDGYASRPSTVFRYQYGRRDLVMFVRHAAQHMVALGMAPIIPEDFSQWDGETPGTDVGAPRHASHQRGKDVDLSLYGDDGLSEWRSYCTTQPTDGGRECIPGTIDGLDGYANALFVGDFFATGRVTMCFLDQELIPALIDGAETAASVGELDASLVPLYSDGTHLQHWPNHDNHVHVRVSEEAASMFGFALREPVFEAP